MKKIVKPPFTPSPDDLAIRLNKLAERAVDRDRESKAKEVDSSPATTAVLPKKELDEFDLLEEEQAFYDELSRHGIDDSYESVTDPANSVRISNIYAEWIRRRGLELEREEEE